MTDEPAPDRPAPSANAAVLGMSSAIVSALVLLYAGDYIFLRLPKLVNVFKTFKANLEWPVQFMFDYGVFLWGIVAICTFGSFVVALRHGGRPQTVGINVAVLIAALVLAFLARQAAWHPFLGMLQGMPQ
jgi:hypothetical protein